MAEQGWVTLKDGRKILINNYMNDKIRNSTKKNKEQKKEDYGYHYGDLGKGRDTYFYSIDSTKRSSGHFGTGTYFYGEFGRKGEQFRTDRPLHKINFSEYNLFKPKNDDDAFLLHRGLREINYFKDLNTYNFDTMKTMLKNYGIKEDTINKAFNKAKETYYSTKYQKASYDANLDSLSTIFMKELGYNGIDVRNLKRFDDGSHGSVIYDLEKKKSKE